jgi:uncharacterized membrane protein YkvA (DUF1232 family)
MGDSIVKKESEYKDFYHKLRKKVDTWAKEGRFQEKAGKWTDPFVQYLMILPDLTHLMIKLLVDKEVSSQVKTYILVAMAYLISPIDFVPDFIPVAGFIDDLIIIVTILNKIINTLEVKLLEKIKSYWAGDDDVFARIKEIVAVINEFSAKIPKGIYNFMNKK